jgi:N-terminal domain of galactosyltransferase
MSNNPALTLITPYRDRVAHLQTQLEWWRRLPDRENHQWIVIELTAEPSIELVDLLNQNQITYVHLPSPGLFHKTKALNLGLKQAAGQWIAPFDVDLIPLGQTLQRHLALAQRSPQFLVTGYRLMAETATVDLDNLELVLEQATIGPEDQPTALRKHLLQGECFGVMPIFEHDRLAKIGGWDEQFIGWGAEDQDLIERYLHPERAICRCPELCYLHLHHGPAAGWNEAALTENNRDYYYRTRRDFN